MEVTETNNELEQGTTGKWIKLTIKFNPGRHVPSDASGLIRLPNFREAIECEEFARPIGSPNGNSSPLMCNTGSSWKLSATSLEPVRASRSSRREN